PPALHSLPTRRSSDLNFFFWYVTAFPQETTRMVRIDSLIAANESRITTVYQKTEKNRIWASHGKNPDKISVVFRFSDDSRLISSDRKSTRLNSSHVKI